MMTYAALPMFVKTIIATLLFLTMWRASAPVCWWAKSKEGSS